MTDILSKFSCFNPDSSLHFIVKVSNDLNCEWDEYEETKNYLNIVDEIIQNNLFKAPEEAEAEQAKVDVLLGFVNIQANIQLYNYMKIVMNN